MKSRLSKKTALPRATAVVPGTGWQLEIRGVDVVAIVDLVRPYPSYPYYQCRVRAEISIPTGASLVTNPVAKIQQGGGDIVSNLPMSYQNGVWYTNQTMFSANPNSPIQAVVTANWIVPFSNTNSSPATTLPHA